MAEPFEAIDAVYQAIGQDLFGRDDLQHALSARDPDEAAFFTLVLVGSEIDNGGFAQLFTNSTGDVFADAIAGADRLGLRDHVRLLRDAGSQFFPDGVPTDQPTRLEKWEAIAERPSVDEHLEQLDERWYALSETLEQRLHSCARTRFSP